ncbi:hypothetical protein MOD25_05165 [Bacillus haynesii]|uniref:hypothetical protein n=1 Tax=Bacillus haynesii TaxID=1925021 RepID=UPI002281666E|nr:hypothetical protein [Bacillus haynesii]MCY8549296.1 hypothetical protein [Bacillus haynesii]
MAKKESRKLTTTAIKKEAKKLKDVQEFVVTVGDENYTLTYDVIFRKTKQQNLLDDLIKFYDAIRNRPEVFELATPYTSLLIIKHFTSLEVPDDVDQALDFLELLIDLDLLVNILNALPEDQLTKVYELLTQTVDQIRINIEKMDEEAQEAYDQIQNGELKELIQEDGEQSTENKEE